MTHDDDPLDDPTRPSAERRGGAWSRFEFEAALPLYVGGDLDPADAAFVEAWIARHPEDRELLDAARSARAVLESHARSAHERPVPDLWPAVRDEMARAGAFRTSASAPAAAGNAAEPGVGRPALADGEGAPILGGASRFRTRAAAVAAAVLLVSSVGVFLGGGSGGSLDGGGASDAGPARVAQEPSFTGPPASARMVRATAGSGTPLQRPASGAEHLIDRAPLEPLWQAPGSMHAIEVLPGGARRQHALQRMPLEDLQRPPGAAELVRDRE